MKRNTIPNGFNLGTCLTGYRGEPCLSDDECDFEMVEGICSMDQEDTYPSQGNGCGDACDCIGNFDGDQDVDGTDAAKFKENFGRSSFNNPCPACVVGDCCACP